MPLLGLLLSACHNPIQQPIEKKALYKKKEEAVGFNLQLGMAYLQRADMIRAKQKFLTALSLDPNSAEACAAIAYFFEKTGDFGAAKKYYHKALSLAPGSGSLLNNYATYLCRRGHYRESEAYFIKAVNDLHYVNTAKAYENAGLCMSQIPDDAKAQWYFAKALKQDPGRRQSLYELTSQALRQKKEAKALAYLQKYPKLVFSDPPLLEMAIEAAHRTQKTKLEATYRRRLSQIGDKNEHNHSSG